MDGPAATDPARADPSRELDRLVRLLRTDADQARDPLARSVGPRLAGLAFVVLQHRPAAEAVAAASIQRAVAAARAGDPPSSPAALDASLTATSLRLALDRATAFREVEARGVVPPGARGITMGPRERAMAATILLAGRTPKEAAALLGLSERAAERAFEEALQAVGSRRALADWLGGQDAGVPFGVTDTAFAAAAAAIEPRPSASAGRWLLPLAVAAGASVILLILIALAVWRPGADGPSAAGGPPPFGAASASPSEVPDPGPFAAGARAPAPQIDAEELTLADCGLQPAGSELSFEGWLMLGDLSSAVDEEAVPLPAYALVTSGNVEWIGLPSNPPRRMLPPPVGRMACAYDPTAETISVLGVSGSWEAPPMVQGCPASPFQRFAGYREIGGPGAFILLPIPGTSWWANDPSVRILARLALSPSAGSVVSATARPLGGGRSMELSVADRPAPPGREPSIAHYVWLMDVQFARGGCWLVTLAVDGEPVGAAVLPVTDRPS